MSAQLQLQALTQALHRLRSEPGRTQQFVQMARSQTALTGALLPRYQEVCSNCWTGSNRACCSAKKVARSVRKACWTACNCGLKRQRSIWARSQRQMADPAVCFAGSC
ncbi:MAG: hypothetical protein JWP47_2466 [Polaromonas sp.]|nr:hypothetical protein [Polaromonas sp.]